MTSQDNLRGMGMVVINAAFVIQLAWIPLIFFLEGAVWPTGATAVAIHRFALLYAVAAPLIYGARLWLRGGRTEALTTWFMRLQLPLTIFAGLIYGLEKAGVPIRLPLIGGMMAVGVMLALYGIALRREGARAH